jgi:lipoprotein-anchoring transpeptidase ErfK/SrfK
MKRQLALLVVLILATSVTASAAGHTKGRAVHPFTTEFKPGDYAWHPEISPAGPVVVIVSLPEQKMYVYRNGVRIGRSTVSTGTKSHVTPTGMFTILQKKVRHESSIYKGAQMPHMQRLTWTGIAMHAGHLPGYPASHGCVRLPIDFAEKLYSVTSNGTSVIITDDKFAPGETAEPGRLLSGQDRRILQAGAIRGPV